MDLQQPAIRRCLKGNGPLHPGLNHCQGFSLSCQYPRAKHFGLRRNVQDGDMSTQLARMLKQAGQAVPESKPILEVNAQHPLVRTLEASSESASFDDLANILFDQALLAEGGMPADPAAYVRRVNALLV